MDVSAWQKETAPAMETRVSMNGGSHLLTLTAGKESYPMAGGGQFEVGPITITLVWDPAEGASLEKVYEGARLEVERLFEAEFAMKQVSYARRSKEAAK
jgi:hypothetical protein